MRIGPGEREVYKSGLVGSANRREFFRSKSMIFLLLGLAAVAWAGHSLITGKGYYKGCPPGGFDRSSDPFSYWAPTIIILVVGVGLILIFLGVIPLPPRSHHG
jgi:hypothetical protein